MHEARRPLVKKASDLMGPGLAPQAVEIPDWNGPETEFNGLYVSRPGALHTPDSAKWWIGLNIAQPGGYGIQKVWDYRSGGTPVSHVRSFTLVGDTRLFSPWSVDGGTSPTGPATVAWEDITGKPTTFQPKTYVHVQDTAVTTWTINHNLGYYPSVTVVDSAGSEVVGDVTYPDANTVTATFGGAFGGRAYLS